MLIRHVPAHAVRDAIQLALGEDRAHDDATTLAIVPADLLGEARLVAREDGIAAGLSLCEAAFERADARAAAHIDFDQLIADGKPFAAGDLLAVARGPVRSLLQGERVGLNFVQRLCGVATVTQRYVAAVAGTNAVILDTRKTTPGLRVLEKYAVRCGGATNHRPDLATMAMLKDNHLEVAASQGISLVDAVARIRERTPGIAVEIEIDRVDQLEDALAAKPEWVLLDNMGPDDLREAVAQNAGRAKLEASGGVTLATVRAIAETGVDAISVGALTHSARALDISLEITIAK